MIIWLANFFFEVGHGPWHHGYNTNSGCTVKILYCGEPPRCRSFVFAVKVPLVDFIKMYSTWWLPGVYSEFLKKDHDPAHPPSGPALWIRPRFPEGCETYPYQNRRRWPSVADAGQHQTNIGSTHFVGWVHSKYFYLLSQPTQGVERMLA